MWNCVRCGCKAIAASLGFCPVCRTVKGDDVPKVSLGGPSNAAAGPGETGYIDTSEPAAAVVPGQPAPQPPAAPAPPPAPPVVAAPPAPAKPAQAVSAPAPAPVPPAPVPPAVTGSGGVTLPAPGAKNE